ncbi:hypothetical protein [Hymenobacter siberiensis]|jgi:hypothetical protein|uniref:hypothetical protein n=1 Tax=Hymenobacter siberiensis TaxID=2848396 RepID=UPI001C1E86B5|nr:hypothetical protein [Hymenobacter siberiensis]MBU6120886.1 hypothetical protein [Hymenobacter siberiensis]
MSFSLDENSPATWWLMLLISTVLLSVFLYTIPDAIHKYDVSKNGKLVSVEITEVREVTIGSRHTYSLHFNYLNQKKPILTIGRSLFDAIRHDKETQLRHLPEYPDLFLAPDYDVKGQSISQVLLICFFAFMWPYSINKIRTLRR